MRARRPFGFVLAGIGLAVFLAGQERPVPPNWAAPLYWAAGDTAKSPDRDERRDGLEGIAAKAVTATSTSPVPLIAITPCRLVDTRDGSRPPGYGPPALAASVPRSFTLTGQCGIAGDALAVSLNVTVVSPQGLGYILIYPQGEGQPVVSTLNYTAGVTVANAAIVPLGGGNGGITVAAAVSGTELLIDTNGYYAPAGAGYENTFLGAGAGNFTMTGGDNSGFGNGALLSNTGGTFNTAMGAGSLTYNTVGGYNTATGAFALYQNDGGNQNTAIGAQALMSNTSGSFNTASGFQALFANTLGNSNTAAGNIALFNNTTGSANTATGAGALFNNTVGTENSSFGFNTLVNNTAGSYNTASGSGALQENTLGDFNTATGGYALFHNTGGYNNAAHGFEALAANTSGWYNTAIGYDALYMNTSGYLNTAIGSQALYDNTTGIYNIALGSGAGSFLESGDNNIYIGNGGQTTESGTVRIGSFGTHQRVFLSGVLGVTGAGVLMQIYPDGQIGSVSSSARYKDDIRDMADASSRLMKLRPVTFRYKGQTTDAAQFGLIAEEVEDVLPELVVRNADGEVEAVQYHEMPAMLLNELQKQQRVIEELQRRLATLESGQCAAEEIPVSAPE